MRLHRRRVCWWGCVEDDMSSESLGVMCMCKVESSLYTFKVWVTGVVKMMPTRRRRLSVVLRPRQRLLWRAMRPWWWWCGCCPLSYVPWLLCLGGVLASCGVWLFCPARAVSSRAVVVFVCVDEFLCVVVVVVVLLLLLLLLSWCAHVPPVSSFVGVVATICCRMTHQNDCSWC